MPITIKLLKADVLTTTVDADFYVVPSTATGGAIISNIRIVNTGGTTKKVNMNYRSSGGTVVKIIERDKQVAAGDLVVVAPELTLAANDIIEAWGESGSTFDCVVSGIERT